MYRDVNERIELREDTRLLLADGGVSWFEGRWTVAEKQTRTLGGTEAPSVKRIQTDGMSKPLARTLGTLSGARLWTPAGRSDFFLFLMSPLGR